MGNVVDVRREMTKTKEQLEEEKKISLSIRIRPLELDGRDSVIVSQVFILLTPGRNGQRRPEDQGQGAVGADCEAGDREIRPGGENPPTGLRCKKDKTIQSDPLKFPKFRVVTDACSLML